MGGFHLLDLAIILLIGLAILGPKTLMSISRKAGEGASHAKDMKDKLMAELPMDEISQVSQNIPRIPQIPTNPQQAVRMLLTSEKKAAQPEEQKKGASVEIPAERTSQEQ